MSMSTVKHSKRVDQPGDSAAVLVEARAFAVGAHAAVGQTYGDEPYHVHLDHVARVLRHFGLRGDIILLAAAYLHDVVEDTQVTIEDVEAYFMPDIAGLVDTVTDRRADGPRPKRKLATYARIQRSKNPFAAVLKLADRIANCEASVGNAKMRRMYEREYPLFREALEHMTRGNVPEAEAMWAHLDSLQSDGPMNKR